jgi:hypothetical protein
MAQGSMRLWTIAGLVVLGACAEPAPQAPPPPVAASAAPAPPAPLAHTTRAAPPQQPQDACGAIPLQSLIGKPRTDIPVPVNPAMRRVVCSTCVITQDYVAGRQTITYDSQTGLVTSVRCG